MEAQRDNESNRLTCEKKWSNLPVPRLGGKTMNFPDVQQWVLLTFSDGDTTYRFLFVHAKFPGGKFNNRSLRIEHFDPSNLVAQSKDDVIQLAGKGIELGFDLDYLSPANDPESIIFKLSNRNNKRGEKCSHNTLNEIRWIRPIGKAIDKNTFLASILEALQPWEIK